MPAQYLLRFDDICSTMNWHVWGKIESVLHEKAIKPILAVVPDNQDPKLSIAPPATDFWQQVRSWQAHGWTIALHGYQHVYVNKNPGILSLATLQSEFAGLPREVQEEKLHSGLAIFKREGVRADCWVAPSHSFDWTTVDLLAELGLKVINDGLWPWPHTDRRGITWVPQQLWGGIIPRPAGVWTVCYHPNGWSMAQQDRFQHDLEAFGSQITYQDEVVKNFAGRQLTLSDSAYAWIRWLRHHSFAQIRQTLEALRR
jgi:peptidoglycan/xylan/chitin deacetylase (PgdA/CDA1 family)